MEIGLESFGIKCDVFCGVYLEVGLNFLKYAKKLRIKIVSLLLVKKEIMKTILDNAYTLFFNGLNFYKDLEVLVSEGIREKNPMKIKIAEKRTIKDSYPVSVSNKFKQYSIVFREVIAWQVVDESYTIFDKSEESDSDDFIKMLTKSKYLDYVNKNHGWYKYIVGKAVHYQLWTESDVFDIIACEKPKINEKEDLVKS